MAAAKQEIGLECERSFSRLELQALDPHSASPLYAQLYRLIADRIRSGSLDYGQPLPAAQDFRVAFNVSIVTVQRAFRKLVSEGLVEMGRGSISSRVIYKPSPGERASKHMTISDSRLISGGAISARTLVQEPRVAPAQIAARLGLVDADTVLFTVTVEEDENSTIAYGETWSRISDLPPANCAYFSNKVGDGDGRIARIEQHVTAGAATIPAVRELRLGVGDPVMYISRCLRNAEDSAVQLSTFQCSAERFRLETHQSV